MLVTFGLGPGIGGAIAETVKVVQGVTGRVEHSEVRGVVANVIIFGAVRESRIIGQCSDELIAAFDTDDLTGVLS